LRSGLGAKGVEFDYNKNKSLFMQLQLLGTLPAASHDTRLAELVN
jgi:hypothetical protein